MIHLNCEYYRLYATTKNKLCLKRKCSGGSVYKIANLSITAVGLYRSSRLEDLGAHFSTVHLLFMQQLFGLTEICLYDHTLTVFIISLKIQLFLTFL